MSQTVLTLQPGGQRFGPLSGMVQIGSDAGRCQVVLPASSGAQGVHAILTSTGSTWQLQPAAIGAAVFLRKTNGRVQPVTSTVQVEPNDVILIGSQSGPGLSVQHLAGQPSAAPSGGGGGGFRVPGAQHLNQNAFAREARRQVESTFVTMPFGREIYRWWTRFRSGALFRPRYIIGAVVGVVGMMGFGCVGCFGVVAAAIGLR